MELVVVLRPMVFQEQKKAVRKTTTTRRRYPWMRTCSQEKTWRSSMKNSTQWHWRTEEHEVEARMDWEMHGVEHQGQDDGFLNFRDSRNKAWLYYDITACLRPFSVLPLPHALTSLASGSGSPHRADNEVAFLVWMFHNSYLNSANVDSSNKLGSC